MLIQIIVNFILLSISIVFSLCSIFIDDNFFYEFAMSLIPLGLFQFFISISLNSKKDKIINFKKYLIIVLLYFLILICRSCFNILHGPDFAFIVFNTALIIAIYFSYLLIKPLTNKNMSFLTAEWNNLVMINYAIDTKILEKYVPNGTEIDFFDNKCYISFIGFMFENVRVLGTKIPNHSDFEEVNLRFYVKRFENGVWKRGAVFISEIVPKSAITLVANTLYHEHYRTLFMRHEILEKENTKSFKYQWSLNTKWNTIKIETEKNPIDIEPNSEAEFITEHYFGYTKVNEKTTFEYEVRHPRWQQLKVITNNSEIDFEQVYGLEFAFVKNLKPTSVFLAIGSPISIEGKKKL